jgi:hypothetical protein
VQQQFVTARLYADTSRSADGDDVVLGKCLWSRTLPVDSHSFPPDPSDGNSRPRYSDSWHGCLFLNDFEGIKLWTAETPDLYTLTLSLTVDQRVVQAESCRVGFRSVTVESGQVRVNGRPITVCGMNRHEHDPDHGKTVSLQSMKKDICLLKYVVFVIRRVSFARSSVQLRTRRLTQAIL